MSFAPPPAMPFPGMAAIQVPRTSEVQEKDEIEQKTEELILMTGGKGPRRWRQRKKEYLKKLEQDNAQLKSLIVDLQQKISAYQAQKDIYRDQLSYFQGCLAQAAPLVFQQQPDARAQQNAINSAQNRRS